jgi:ubiquinol-cytochrome c reductase cytochrome c subunit
VLSGFAYTAAAPGQASAASAQSDQIASGHQLFQANCSTCHGLNGQGSKGAPALVGVGAAAVDFQVGTGRMPYQGSGPQAPKGQVRFSAEQITQLAAYVASLGPGPGVPDAQAVDSSQGDPARGALIFRTNCAMCHGATAKGGALTRGKYAPSLSGVTGEHMYEAMVTGPQSMPVFNDQTIDPKSKRDVIAFLTTIDKSPTPGGFSLGAIGPVSEGLVGWVVGLALLIGCAVWLGAKTS